MSLEDYNKKRDFSQTSEPEGKSRQTEGQLKFVVQRHAASHLHYDFRLEMDGVLKSWAIPKGPSLNPSDKRLAMHVEDHPYSYRTFEGSIPKGNYGAGEVEIWDEGWYEPLEKTNNKTDDLILRSELHKGSLKLLMHGEKLKGEFALVKIKSDETGKSWLLIKHKDNFSTSNPYDAEDYTDPESKVSAYLQHKSSKKNQIAQNTSASYRNFTTALSCEKKLKNFIEPMFAKSAEKPFDGKDWAFEIKWDGYRAVADLRNELQLYSRNGLDFSKKFKKILNQLKLQNYPMVLDGELVAYDETGKPNFQWLQQIGEKPNLAVVFQVFDLLWLNGHSTKNIPYLQRKELLKEALLETENIKFCDHILESGKDFFKAAENMGLEGIIAKNIESTYSEGIRSSEWLKIKIQQTEDVVVVGFTEPKGARKKFGSLILGKYDEHGQLVFAGQAGTGFTDKTLVTVYDALKPLVVSEHPFKKLPKTNAKPTWIRPELIAEIKFSEITKDGVFRHPVFLRLREEKVIEDLKPALYKEEIKITSRKNEENGIIRENKNVVKIGKQMVKLTNQSKIYFPKDLVSKGDVINYYQSISTYILPHLNNRPQSLNRFPNGIEGMSFYQKDAGEKTPDWIHTKKIFSEKNKETINYFVCNDAATLAYLNNLGCIEMNVWTSTIQNLENPDYLVLDLDPSEKNTFEDVIETAQMVKTILDKAKIEGYPKTSGSSGIHIYIPMGKKYAFEQVKNFAHVLMQMVQRELPHLTTFERSLTKRVKNKIYLDYLQNRRAQTLASVYSLRPKNGAPVSMPLAWAEVKTGLKPTDWNIENAPERIRKLGDLFKPTLMQGIDMLNAIENLE